MGQRLNIEITSGNKVLANSYYHWSAYTQDAAEMTMKIIEEYNRLPKDKNIVRYAISLLQSATETGVNKDERIRIESGTEQHPEFADIEFRDCSNRNKGILAVTDEGISETRSWADGCVVIDIKNEIVTFDVCCVESRRDMVSDWDNGGEIYDRLPVASFPLASIRFCQFKDFLTFVENNPMGFRSNEGIAFLWIA